MRKNIRQDLKAFFKDVDYRHYICIAITIGFALVSAFVFPHAIPRLGEAFRDFGLSIANFFAELLGFSGAIVPSVISKSKMPFTLSGSFPATWEEFKLKFTEYWQAWANGQNVFNYIFSMRTGALVFAYIITLFTPLVVILFFVIKHILGKQNNRYNQDTKPLIAFKKLSDKTYRPAKAWLIEFINFVKDYKLYFPAKKLKPGDVPQEPKGISYWEIWAFIWLLSFNAFTIVIELVAYYYYFCVSFDVLSLYTQIYKLLLDLSVMIKFVPIPVWVVFAYCVIYKLAIRKGYDNLNHNERKNRGVLNSLGIIKQIYGYVGAGKTSLATEMALSYEVQMIDDALEIMLDIDMHFPYFPWINLENEIRRAIRFHVIYDKWSCWRWVDKKLARWKKSPNRERIFDYDYERYGVSFDDKLTLTNIWQEINDYTCAYVIYVRQTSYIISNYPIRSDIIEDYIGNFPLRNTDFFKRDSKLIDKFSRFSHILDFDMLRLGKIMLKNNPNQYAFGWGVYVITEIDKEFKNSPELQDIKKSAEECNQKNDLSNVTLTISRHIFLLRHKVFGCVVGDMQRVGSLGSKTVELGDLVLVDDKTECSPVLPWYSPFWLFDGIVTWVSKKFRNFYLQYRYDRSDNSLIMYILHSIVSQMDNYCERIYNLFGTEVLSLEVKNGLDDSKNRIYKWYRAWKKVYPKRFASDCMSPVFSERGKLNTVGGDDLAVYADIMPTNDERELQHSHMEREFNLFRQNNTSNKTEELKNRFDEIRLKRLFKGKRR